MGARGILKVPSGQFQNLASNLPTGGGDVGVGGEARIIFRSPGAEIGGAIGMMALLPFTADGHDVSRGDPLWLAGWASGRLGSTTRLGLAVMSLARGADRVDNQQVSSLESGGEPGARAPQSSLLSVAPYLEFKGGHDSSVVLSVANDALGWLFLPVPSGIAVTGKNVMAPEPEVTLRLITGL